MQFDQLFPFKDQNTFHEKNLQMIFNSLKKSLFIQAITKDILTEHQLNQLKKWVGEVIEIVSEEARKLESPDEIHLKFASRIVEEYRKFIIDTHEKISEPEKIFQQAASSKLEFLHYQYPQPSKTSDIRKNQNRHNINLKYSLLPKLFKMNYDRNNRQKIRVDTKKFIHQLGMQSDEKYKDFMGSMNSFFSSIQRSTIRYTMSKRMSKSNVNEKMLSSPAFTKCDKETLEILKEWINHLLDYFKDSDIILDNHTGFCNSKGNLVKFIRSDREKLAKLFQSKNSQLERQIEVRKKQLMKTITNIILISKSRLMFESSKEYIHYLDKDEVSLIMICQSIAKAIQDYILDILVIILAQIFQIQKDFHNITIEDELEKVELATFIFTDLYKCKCTGTRQDIEEIMKKLLSEKDKLNFEIIEIRNRLDQLSKDAVVNFVIRDPNVNCHFICELELVASLENSEKPFSFPNFLLELSETNYGIIAELGLLFYNLDYRKDYIEKKNIVFCNQKYDFVVKDQKMYCKKKENHKIVNENVKVSYVCNECFKYTCAYLYCFSPCKCEQCQIYICPVCYFTMYNQKKTAQIMMSFVPKLEQFFYPVDNYENPFVFTQNSDIIQLITNERLKEPQQLSYYGILTFQNNMHSYQLQIVRYPIVSKFQIEQILQKQAAKQPQHHEQTENNLDQSIPSTPMGNERVRQRIKKTKKKNKKYLSVKDFLYTSFSNEHIQLSSLDSFTLIIKPRTNFRLEVVSKQDIQKAKNQYTIIVDSLHRKHFGNEKNYNLFVLVSDEHPTKLQIDYSINGQVLKDIISQNSIKKKLKALAKSPLTDHSLKFENEAINLTFLEGMPESQNNKITQINIINGKQHNQYPIYGQFQLLKKLTKLRRFTIERTPSYHNVQFGLSLQEIHISQCNILTFNFNAYPNIKIICIKKTEIKELPILKLQELTTLEIINSNITSIANLQFSQIPKIDRIAFFKNKFTHFPLLRGKIYSNLRVVDMKTNQINDVDNLRRCQLPNLQYLILPGNKISGIFPSVGHFTDLQYLRLANNQIEFVEGFHHQNLKGVFFTFNKLKSIPKIICEGLDEMNLVGNELQNEQQLGKIIEEIFVSCLDLVENDRINYLPFVKTRVEYIRIEYSKILCPINNLWENSQLPEAFFCDECGLTLVSFGRYSSKDANDGEDYCKDCYQQHLDEKTKQGLIKTVVLSRAEIIRNI